MPRRRWRRHVLPTPAVPRRRHLMVETSMYPSFMACSNNSMAVRTTIRVGGERERRRGREREGEGRGERGRGGGRREERGRKEGETPSCHFTNCA